MTRQLRTFLVEIASALLIGAALALVIPQAARGAVIATDDVLATEQAGAECERIKALVLRPELAQSLEKMGIAPQDAAARVDAMNDAEVRSLAGRLEALPAGGALSNTDFLLVVIIIILVVVLL